MSASVPELDQARDPIRGTVEQRSASEISFVVIGDSLAPIPSLGQELPFIPINTDAQIKLWLNKESEELSLGFIWVCKQIGWDFYSVLKPLHPTRAQFFISTALAFYEKIPRVSYFVSESIVRIIRDWISAVLAFDGSDLDSYEAVSQACVLVQFLAKFGNLDLLIEDPRTKDFFLQYRFGNLPSWRIKVAAGEVALYQARILLKRAETESVKQLDYSLTVKVYPEPNVIEARSKKLVASSFTRLFGEGVE